MKKKFIFEVHTYSPEQNKIFYNGVNVTDFYKKLGLRVDSLKKDYNYNMIQLRKIKNNQKVNTKIYGFLLSNSAIIEAEKENIKLGGKGGYYGKYKEFSGYCINVVEAYKLIKNYIIKNDNKKMDIIINFNSENKAIYKEFINSIKIEKVKFLKEGKNEVWKNIEWD